MTKPKASIGTLEIVQRLHLTEVLYPEAPLPRCQKINLVAYPC